MAELPYIEKRYKMKLDLDTLTIRLVSVKHSGGETRIFGYWGGGKNLSVHQPRLSSADIVVPDASALKYL